MLAAVLQLERQRLERPFNIEKISSAREVLLECSSRNTRPLGMLEVFASVLAEFLKWDESAITEEDIERVFTEAAAALAVVEAGKRLLPEQHVKLCNFLLILQRRIMLLWFGKWRLARTG